MTRFKKRLGDVVGAGFAALGADASLGAVTRSERPDLSDFQCNGAFRAAKALKRNPRERTVAACARDLSIGLPDRMFSVSPAASTSEQKKNRGPDGP